ncbi:P1 family peptidase [Roseovarius sp. C7]|uniref:DmpA family aminopeptidase n=1 Tax=Roseovarius sp. C7 TaxID=3398643 RepID=UPI0039F57096
MKKPRARDLGFEFQGITGPLNGVTDVPGVLAGQATVTNISADPADAGPPQIRTGVTAVLPFGHDSEPKIAHAGIYALNGNGEMTGSHWIRDAGHFLGPVCITNTHSVGITHHAATKWMIGQYSEAFRQEHLWAMPVIAETYDGVLNDINGQHVSEANVLEALNSANSGPVAEGNTGGGTGMICYEFKGGTGTASRVVEVGGQAYTFGVLVQANHGIRDWLTVLGEPVGRQMQEHRLLEKESGSIIVIIATDAPLRPDQLTRVAKRGAIGISRSGSPGGNNSGDIFLAFSTGNARPLPQRDNALQNMQHLNDECLDVVYQAVVEAIDESILNAMLAAEDTPTEKPQGHVCKAIDPEALTELLRRAGKCR